MKHLIFEIVKHGASAELVSPGPPGEFNHVATGSGSSEWEAGQDAQEIFLRSVPKGVSIFDLMRLEGKLTQLSQEENAHDLCGDCQEGGDCAAAHYVSIKWRLE